jgi:hypothetical protein
MAAACVAVLVTGCAAGGPTSTARHVAARATAAAYPARQVLAKQYLVIAVAGNRRLDVDFGRLDGRDRSDLARSEADLRDIAATERLFDRQLLILRFPPATEAVAQTLVKVNQARADLTVAITGVAGLAQLRAYQTELTLANVPVEQEVSVIRAHLGLPPPDAS